MTNHAAGDNYQIEASTLPDFGSKQTCDTANNCFRSGVLTAWKRVYTEIDRMFRAGALLSEDIPQCSATSCPSTVVVHVDDAAPLAKAKRVRLVHAPRFDGTGIQSFYYEDVDVVKVNKKKDTVEIVRPTRPFQGPDEISLNDPLDFLADGMGQITGAGTPSDFYDVNRGNIDGVYNAAFVEYVHLDDDPVAFVPIVVC